MEEEQEKKFGVVALVGRPNAGKSTLVNRLLGEKVSIVSNKPQTTRNRIVGIFTEERGQTVLVDTPGIHKPLHRMNVRMMDHVTSTFSEADLIMVILDASQSFGHGDEFVIEMLKSAKTDENTMFALLNKIDLVKKSRLLPVIQQYHDLGLFDEIVPISAQEGDGVDTVLDLIFANLPPGPPRYPDDVYTTQPERFLVSEIIREKLLHHTEKELPFTTAVSIERWEEEADRDLVRIYATIFVERDSQKPIVVGRGGEMIKTIGSEARQEIEAILGTRLYLDLRVAVHSNWREDDRFLGDLEWPLGGS
jgi:GTPase